MKRLGLASKILDVLIYLPLGYFVGQIMKATQGKANPKQVNEILKKKLG